MKTDQRLQIVVTAQLHGDPKWACQRGSDTEIDHAVVVRPASRDWVPNRLQAAIASGEATLISDVRGGPRQQAEVNAVHHLHGVQGAADRNAGMTPTEAPSVRTSIEAAFVLLVVLLFNI
jgi:hypothetical protein